MDKNKKFKVAGDSYSPRRSTWLAQTVVGLTMLGLIASSHAANWSYSPAIFSSATYTDNVFLASKGNEVDELIFEISPSVQVNRTGKQLDLAANYRLQGLFHTNEDARNQAYSYLQASANSRVIPEFFYVDVSSSINQTVIDPRRGIGNSAISASGNTSEVINLNVSPYIQRRIGAYTVLRTGYRGGLVEYDEPELFDSKQNEVFFTLANTGGAGIFDWQLNYSQRTIEYDIGREIELTRAGADMGVRIGPRTELVVAGGEDSNDIGFAGSRVAEGTYWNVGLRGGIGANTEYEFRIGEQFFGESYSARFSRSTRRVNTQFTYTEAATTVGAQQLDYSNAQLFISDVLGIDLPGSDPALYIRKRIDLSGELQSPKSSWTGNVYYEDRNFISTSLNGESEQAMGVGVQWQWQYDDLTSLQASTNFTRFNSRDGVSQPKDVRFSVNLRRSVFKNSYLTTSFWRTSRSANSAIQEYVVNGISLGIGRQF